MRRRKFITLLGGAVATWPLAARGQQLQPSGTRRVFIMLAESEDDPQMQARAAAFRKGLEELGWTEGRNIRLDYRWLASDAARARGQAAEIGALAPDLIMIGTRSAMDAAKETTRSIPIVFANLADPVGSGLVDSLARPGGNITGFAAFEFAITGKWVGLLKEMSPQINRVAFLFDPDIGSYALKFFSALETAAPSFAVQAFATEVRNAADIERALGAFADQPNGGLLTMPSAITNTYSNLILKLASRYKLPAIYPFRYLANAGGLASYGPDLIDQFRLAAGYTERILRGAKPADLPVQNPTKYELAINLKAAKALGLTVPNISLLVERRRGDRMSRLIAAAREGNSGPGGGEERCPLVLGIGRITGLVVLAAKAPLRV